MKVVWFENLETQPANMDKMKMGELKKKCKELKISQTGVSHSPAPTYP